ncbi:hypothetical protein HU200_028420 [Digitaria exilis]|uniref:Acetyltransferase n=1 Tax=Digitaria exilis TaxID=1010633 RepID=A0A835ESC9_9POAL|nr:hypothetical protein HU200_028420 [Digitaria exilis]
MDYYIPSVLWSLFPLNRTLGVDVSHPVLGAQVTELADGIFIAVSLNHTVADGTTFWHFINTWSEISWQNSSRDWEDAAAASTIVTGSSPRFDVYNNDFGWGRLVAVRRERRWEQDGREAAAEDAQLQL